jgi:3-hydroxyacyl-[acyl-carrier-protein] dehydratase
LGAACKGLGPPLQTADYGLKWAKEHGPRRAADRAGLLVKFNLLDKIESLSDSRIVASKQVSLAEEYLADHFPTFPVLPGVLMLEALAQAAGWLLHHRRNFACSMAILREARNVKYGQFVAPGNALKIDVELVKLSDGGASFKGAGSVGTAQAVSARLELSYFNLSEKRAEFAEIDGRLRENNRRRWNILNAAKVDVAMEAAAERS